MTSLEKLYRPEKLVYPIPQQHADMLADIFTKQLPRPQFEKLRSRLGLT